MDEIQFFSQYCDDVRREADGRMSLMGVYPGQIMVANTAHFVVPKISVQAVLIVPMNTPFTSISVWVTWNGEKLRESALPQKMLARLVDESDTERQEDGRVVLSFVLELKDVDMSQSGVLRTFAQVAGRTIEGLSLCVKHANKAKKKSSLKR